MKIFRIVIQLGMAIAIILAIGCNDVRLALQSGDHLESTSSMQPFALLSIAPKDDWIASLWLPGEIVDSAKLPDVTKLMSEHCGIDMDRRMVAVYGLSEVGASHPLLYLPVSDYDKFLKELDRRFDVKQAVASSLTIGRSRLIVMQVGEYAVIGTSLKGIEQGPKRPEELLVDLPQDYDLVFQCRTEVTQKVCSEPLVHSIKSLLGPELSDLMLKSKSVTYALRIRDDRSLEFFADIEAAKTEQSELQEKVAELVSVREDWKLSESEQSELLKIKGSLASTQANATYMNVRNSLVKIYDSIPKSAEKKFAFGGSQSNSSLFSSTSQGVSLRQGNSPPSGGSSGSS